MAMDFLQSGLESETQINDCYFRLFWIICNDMLASVGVFAKTDFYPLCNAA